MILDIRYCDGKPPEQIQNVRATHIYPHNADSKECAMLIEFYNAVSEPIRTIDLNTVYILRVTND